MLTTLGELCYCELPTSQEPVARLVSLPVHDHYGFNFIPQTAPVSHMFLNEAVHARRQAHALPRVSIPILKSKHPALASLERRRFSVRQGLQAHFPMPFEL
jgi:hypothetical protein